MVAMKGLEEIEREIANNLDSRSTCTVWEKIMQEVSQIQLKHIAYVMPLSIYCNWDAVYGTVPVDKINYWTLTA